MNSNEPPRLLTPWGVPYYGPVERAGDLLSFWHEGKRYALRPEFVEAGDERTT